MPQTVVGMFTRQEDAHATVKDLIDHDFDPAEVSLIQRQSNGHEQTMDSDDASAPTRRATAIGGVAGLLAGSSVFFIPGIGPILVVGGLVAALVGGVGGALLGNLVGTLVASGVSEDEAAHLAEHVQMGGTLVAVRADGPRLLDAQSILRQHNGSHIEQRPQPPLPTTPHDFGETLQ